LVFGGNWSFSPLFFPKKPAILAARLEYLPVDCYCYNDFMKGRRIKCIEKHSNEWIALDSSKNKIIFSGKNFQKVYEEAHRRAVKPVLLKVPRLDASFAG